MCFLTVLEAGSSNQSCAPKTLGKNLSLSLPGSGGCWQSLGFTGFAAASLQPLHHCSLCIPLHTAFPSVCISVFPSVLVRTAVTGHSTQG